MTREEREPLKRKGRGVKGEEKRKETKKILEEGNLQWGRKGTF